MTSMYKKMAWLLGGLAACLVLAAAPAGAAKVVNRVLAVVGDDIVTSLDVDRLIKTIQSQAASRGDRLGPADLAELRKVALDRLIEDKIFEQEVKRLGIKVSPAQVDRYVERIKKLNHIDDATFAAQLSRRGLTPEEYRRQLKKDILKQSLIARQVKNKIVISDTQVEEYYRKHISDYQKLDQVRLRAIFLNLPRDASPVAMDLLRQKAEKIRAQAVKNHNFAELARKYSQGPGADKGGELGPLSSDDLIPAMRQALGELKPGQVSPVIKAPMGYLIIQLISRTGQSTIPLAQVKDQIRDKLEKQATEKKFRQWLSELRKKTYVKKMQ